MSSTRPARDAWINSPSPAAWLVACAVWLTAAPALAGLCYIPPNGSGSADLPPVGPECTEGYLTATDLHMIIDGLPPGSTIEIGVEHRGFFNITTSPGGPLGGETETFDSELVLSMTGTGDLSGFSRQITLPVSVTTAVGLRGVQRVQRFPNEMVDLFGELFGDPDFDHLRVSAGTSQGLPSSGETVLAERAGGDWYVDSFFDITYQIEFTGAPGSQLEGMSGITTASANVRQGEPYIPGANCIVDEPPVPGDPIPLPPDCASGQGYVSPSDFHMMMDGLPPGSEVEIKPEHRAFFNIQRQAGGPLGGEEELFESELVLELTGTGGLDGYQRVLTIPAGVHTATAPQNPPPSSSDPPDEFETEMIQMQGQLDTTGDPDFDFFGVQVDAPGTGIPNPGLTRTLNNGNGTFTVDSFFDITYRIDYQGAPGGPFDGVSGSTIETTRVEAGDPLPEPGTAAGLVAGALALAGLRRRRS